MEKGAHLLTRFKAIPRSRQIIAAATLACYGLADLAAYDGPHTLTGDQILERLLTLNLERAAK